MEHITSHGFSIKQLLRILTLAPSSTGFVRRLSTGTRVLAVDISDGIQLLRYSMYLMY